MKWHIIFLIFIFLSNGAQAVTEKVRRITLSNGLNVFLLKDTSLPYIQLELIVPMGSSTDSKKGLSHLVSKALSKGTTKKTSSELIVHLENLGSKFSSSTSRDFSSFSAGSLSWNQDQLLNIFNEIISQPAFQEKEINWVKKQFLSKIKKSPEQPMNFARRILLSSVFQFENYNHNPVGSLKSLNSIQHADVLQHYKKYFVPQNSILGISGQYSHDIKRKLEKYFSSWKKTKKISLPALTKKSKTKNKSQEPLFFIIHKKGQTQSNIRMGKKAIHRADPDYLAVQIANIILGAGGFESRLFSELRVKRGLTYGINSRIHSLMYDGILSISSSTRLNVTKKSIDLILDTLEFFYKKGVTSEEVEEAKKNYKTQILSSLGKAENRLSRQMLLKFYGLPYDVPNLNRKLNKIKVKNINHVIKKYFSPYQSIFIIFTDFNKVKTQFEDIQHIKVKNFNEFL